MRFDGVEETDKVSLISVSFLPPIAWIFDSLSVLNHHFTQQKNSFNAFGTITCPDGNVAYLRLANRVRGLVFSKTVNKSSLMIKERLEKD
jgi:hypothetical protein